MSQEIVIVGGGFGGLAAAQGLGGVRDVHVTLVDRHNYHLFQPLLYQVASGVLSPADIASPIRTILRRYSNIAVVLADARSIDVERRAVMLDQGEARYDMLVLAPGSTHAYFGHDEWAEPAPSLKTLDDALEIRRRVLLAFERAERADEESERTRLLTFVVIGAGPTGVELAGALAGIARHALADEFRRIRPESARVLLIEGGPTVLPTFPPDLREAAERSLQKLGVDVRKNSLVTGIDERSVQLGSERIDAATVLWAAGVAASPLGHTLGVATDRAGRIVVQADLTVPGHPEIAVIGDLALARDEKGRQLPGLAAVAQQQGRHVAGNIRRAITQQKPLPFRYRSYGNLATIGRAAAVADFDRVHLTGWIAWIAWLFIHLMKLIGFRNRFAVLVQWLWSYVTFQPSARLITGDDRVWGSENRSRSSADLR